MNLDDILDQALEDFENDHLNSKAKKIQNVPTIAPHLKQKPTSNSKPSKDVPPLYHGNHQVGHELMMDGVHDPRYGNTLQSTLKSLSKTSQGNETVENIFSSLSQQYEKEFPQPQYYNDSLSNQDPKTNQNNLTSTMTNDKDQMVAGTLKMLAQSQNGMEGYESQAIESTGEKMMEDMISQFEELGEKEDYNEVIDGVMKQLLSYELMYQPTKLLCERYPEWLVTHKNELTETQYLNYGKQYQTFQKILAVYENEPDNYPRLMELMFDIQQYEQPPADIIKDLAPGLKFDENGIPIMPNMGSGFMPDKQSHGPSDGHGGAGGATDGELPDLGNLAEQMQSGQCLVM